MGGVKVVAILLSLLLGKLAQGEAGCYTCLKTSVVLTKSEKHFSMHGIFHLGIKNKTEMKVVLVF